MTLLETPTASFTLVYFICKRCITVGSELMSSKSVGSFILMAFFQRFIRKYLRYKRQYFLHTLYYLFKIYFRYLRVYDFVYLKMLR